MLECCGLAATFEAAGVAAGPAGAIAAPAATAIASATRSPCASTSGSPTRLRNRVAVQRDRHLVAGRGAQDPLEVRRGRLHLQPAGLLVLVSQLEPEPRRGVVGASISLRESTAVTAPTSSDS